MFHSLRLRLILITAVLPMITIAAAGLMIRQANANTFDRGGDFTLVADRLDAIGTARAESMPSGVGGVTVAGGGQLAGEVAPPPASGHNGPDRICGVPFEATVSLFPVDVRPLDASAGAFVYSGTGEQRFALAGAPQFVKAFEKDQEESLYSLNLRVAGVIGSAGLICGLVGFVASQRILKPVTDLTGAARRLEAGDLAQRVEHEGPDEIGQLSHAFNSMAEGLERTESLRKTMTSDIAHELRTPLNNIAGFVDMLSDGLVEPDARVLATLQDETQLLVALVDDLEQLSLGDAGQLRLELSECDAVDAVQRGLNAMAPRAAERGVTLQLQAEPGIAPLPLDPARFDQVIRNLLENAIRHTPEGGSVTASVTAAPGGVSITIEDTGEGIAADHLPNIFERFYRADSSRTRRTGGSGLGLAIVRQIVEAHGGSVTAENRPAGGASFAVILPR